MNKKFLILICCLSVVCMGQTCVDNATVYELNNNIVQFGGDVKQTVSFFVGGLCALTAVLCFSGWG